MGRGEGRGEREREGEGEGRGGERERGRGRDEKRESVEGEGEKHTCFVVDKQRYRNRRKQIPHRIARIIPRGSQYENES